MQANVTQTKTRQTPIFLLISNICVLFSHTLIIKIIIHVAIQIKDLVDLQNKIIGATKTNLFSLVNKTFDVQLYQILHK